MNVFLNVFFLFLFVYTLTVFRLPNINDGRYILHKILFFIGIFCFQFTLLLMSKMMQKCKIDIEELLFNAFSTALYGILGYSFYNDIIFAGSDGLTPRMFYLRPGAGYLFASIGITMVIAASKLVMLSFNRDYQICIKN